jgi:hypothetical protein
MDEFAKWRLISIVRPQTQSKKEHREN